MLFARAQKTVQRDGIFAHLRVNQKRDVGMKIAQRVKRGQRDMHEVADAAHIHQHLNSAVYRQAYREAAQSSRVHPPAIMAARPASVNARTLARQFLLRRRAGRPEDRGSSETNFPPGRRGHYEKMQ